MNNTQKTTDNLDRDLPELPDPVTEPAKAAEVRQQIQDARKQ